MAHYCVILTAQKVEGCPLYKKGDRIVLNLPEVDMVATGKTCAFIVAMLLHKRLRRKKDQPCELKSNFANPKEYLAEFQITDEMFYCPRVCGSMEFARISEFAKPTAPTIGDVCFQVAAQERADDVDLTKESSQNAILTRLSPIFAGMDAFSLLKILPELKGKSYKPGETILEQGQQGRYLFIIYEGEVEVFHGGKGEPESVLGHLKTGDCFGEMSLLTGEPVSATIRAAAPSKILALPASLFRRLMETTPAMSTKFTKVLTRRIRSSNQRISTVLSSGMVGQLQSVHLPELLQTLCVPDCSGILHLNNQGTEGKIYIQAGDIVHATLQGEQGAECVFTMLKWNKGEFRFERKEIQEERSIHASAMSLLLEGMRRLDEETVKLPPGEMPILQNVSQLEEAASLAKNEPQAQADKPEQTHGEESRQDVTSDQSNTESQERPLTPVDLDRLTDTPSPEIEATKALPHGKNPMPVVSHTPVEMELTKVSAPKAEQPPKPKSKDKEPVPYPNDEASTKKEAAEASANKADATSEEAPEPEELVPGLEQVKPAIKPLAPYLIPPGADIHTSLPTTVSKMAGQDLLKSIVKFKAASAKKTGEEKSTDGEQTKK